MSAAGRGSGDRAMARQARQLRRASLPAFGAAADGDMDEIEALIEESPAASAHYAAMEMHYGRLAWLAEHIRRCDFQISPEVARKLLAMLEGTDPHCYFELKAVRRSDLPPRAEDPQLRLFRAADMAIEVARKSGFKRGKLKKALYEVGQKYGLGADYVGKEVRRFKQYGLEVVAEENAQAAYEGGEVDFLGRSISP